MNTAAAPKIKFRSFNSVPVLDGCHSCICLDLIAAIPCRTIFSEIEEICRKHRELFKRQKCCSKVRRINYRKQHVLQHLVEPPNVLIDKKKNIEFQLEARIHYTKKNPQTKLEETYLKYVIYGTPCICHNETVENRTCDWCNVCHLCNCVQAYTSTKTWHVCDCEVCKARCCGNDATMREQHHGDTSKRQAPKRSYCKKNGVFCLSAGDNRWCKDFNCPGMTTGDHKHTYVRRNIREVFVAAHDPDSEAVDDAEDVYRFRLKTDEEEEVEDEIVSPEVVSINLNNLTID